MQHTVHLFDGFQLDVTRRKLISSGGLVQPLNSRAMEALLLLVVNAGELVGKRRLMQTVWPDAIVEDNNLNQCILAIRKALGETAGSNRYIMTVPGRGYRFVSPVRSVTRESGSEAATVVPGRRTTQTMWLAVLSMACAAPLVFLMSSIERGPPNALVPATQIATVPQGATPDIILRLREPSRAEVEPTGGASRLLSQCMTAYPAVTLRVQLQLVDASRGAVWTGEYLASAEDLLAPQPIARSTMASCRALGVVVDPGRKKKMSVH